MTLDEIKQAVDSGTTVYCFSTRHCVVNDGARYVIKHGDGTCENLECDGEVFDNCAFITSADWELAQFFIGLPVEELQRILSEVNLQ